MLYAKPERQREPGSRVTLLNSYTKKPPTSPFSSSNNIPFIHSEDFLPLAFTLQRRVLHCKEISNVKGAVQKFWATTDGNVSTTLYIYNGLKSFSGLQPLETGHVV